MFLDDATKRALIRNSIAWHRQKGTRAAVEKINAAFNHEIKIEEWFEYAGGEPFHFKIKTKPFFQASDQVAWLRQLYDAKPVRAWCDVTFEAQIETPLYVGIGRWSHGRKRRLMTADYKVGRVTTTLIDGARTLEISATEVIISYGVESEVIPLDNLLGDVLRMRFSFPAGDRVLTVENPREDLTPEEVQEVADYATENKIFLDAAGETTSEFRRATLITTTTQILF